MGCGPSTKETTLHHYRDPLTALLAADPQVDFQGVILAGTSDEDEHKRFVAGRTAALLEAMRVDGVIISIDSWGNCHIDFAELIQAVGERGIPLSALSFIGQQAAFVVSNSYMKTVIDLNKSSEGVESCIMGQNSATELDAVKALAVLKSRIRRKNPEKEWNLTAARQIRRLIRRNYRAQEVLASGANSFDGRSLRLDADALAASALARARGEFSQARSARVSIIRPGETALTVNSILDFLPVAAKQAGRIGEGITHLLQGCQVMLTAVEEGGFQPVNAGGAYGRLSDAVFWNRAGTPAKSDFLIHVDVLLAEGEGRTRAGIMAAHLVCDGVMQAARTALKSMSRSQAERSEELWDEVKTGGLRIALVKLVPGLGCMYDTFLFGDEPCGFIGAGSIMDLSNKVQIVLSPNEYRDGAVRSLT